MVSHEIVGGAGAYPAPLVDTLMIVSTYHIRLKNYDNVRMRL
jgi:hypothetical protein